MDSYIIGIGQKIRAVRKEKNILASDLAKRAQVSNGLISRIENGRTIPSLPVLLAIIQALDIKPGDFFGDIHGGEHFNFLVLRKHEYTHVEKEIEATGFSYKNIFGRQLNCVGTEFVILTLEPGCKRNLVETDAFEFKYVLQGDCTYQIGTESVTIGEGDSIFLDGRIPHVPKNTGSTPCIMLVVYLFTA